FFGKPLYECAGIHKVKTFAAVPEAYAFPGESEESRVTGFFELYQRIAERNRSILAGREEKILPEDNIS
ncbi:MAG: hypothetical protein LBR47_00395, partial [Spirochaetaceae bacterium]|nr:hypothetical protein [Spirochaetaceae bacterium]